MEKQLNLVFVGHIDHGKSTLIGRLMYDTDSIPKEKIEEIKRVCEELGVPLEFAYITDALEEEREKRITIDTTQVFFKSKKREYVIIDAPGHREFLKNMVTGASYADAAILIVDVSEGVKDQTKRHAYVLNFLGIDQIIVVINKMDKVNWDEEKFNQVKKDILEFLGRLGLTPKYVIPISAYEGDNVVKKSENMVWYSGPTVLEALDSLETTQTGYAHFRMPVQLMYNYKGKKLALGSIISGKLCKGDKVLAYPNGDETEVKAILQMNKELEEVTPLEAIALELDNPELVDRGVVLCSGEKPLVTNKLHASFICLKDGIKEGDEVEIFVTTQVSPGRISKVKEKINIETLEPEEGKEIGETEVGIVEITLEKPLVVDEYSKMRELGRFIVKKNGRIVGGGILI